tara:strand:- start:26925 stop:27161 length:237 start_codon:yes stop_codon:yes gene_type:complete
MKLSRSQKIMRLFTSEERFKMMKEESMIWGFTCLNCTERTSFWEMGGIRYKASGTPKMRFSCPKCKHKAIQLIDKLEL